MYFLSVGVEGLMYLVWEKARPLLFILTTTNLQNAGSGLADWSLQTDDPTRLRMCAAKRHRDPLRREDHRSVHGDRRRADVSPSRHRRRGETGAG